MSTCNTIHFRDMLTRFVFSVFTRVKLSNGMTHSPAPYGPIKLEGPQTIEYRASYWEDSYGRLVNKRGRSEFSSEKNMFFLFDDWKKTTIILMLHPQFLIYWTSMLLMAQLQEGTIPQTNIEILKIAHSKFQFPICSLPTPNSWYGC